MNDAVFLSLDSLDIPHSIRRGAIFNMLCYTWHPVKKEPVHLESLLVDGDPRQLRAEIGFHASRWFGGMF
jgi:hypothetical protein